MPLPMPLSLSLSMSMPVDPKSVRRQGRCGA